MRSPASAQDRAAAAKVLLAHHSDVEARDNKKNTAVLRACIAHRTCLLALCIRRLPPHLYLTNRPPPDRRITRVVRRPLSTALSGCSCCC